MEGLEKFFCWNGQKGKCTPAMAAGLAQKVWTIKEGLTYPACQ